MCVIFMTVSDNTYAASKIHLRKSSVSIYLGKTYQQKLIDKKGKTISASKVTWATQDPGVAVITSKGKITAISRGTAKMTAKYKGKTYKFSVKVKASVWGSPHDLYLKVGETAQFEIFGRYTRIMYSSLDEYLDYEEVISDYDHYVIEAIGLREGCEKINVKDKNSEDIIRVFANDPSLSNTSVNFELPSVTVELGKTVDVKCFNDKGCLMRWESDNNNILYAWEFRKADNCDVLRITGGKLGTSVITVYDLDDPGVTATLDVTVVK